MSGKPYKKSRGVRIQSVIALLAILSLGADVLLFAGQMPVVTSLLLLLFLGLCLAFLVSAFFDVYSFDGKEVVWENRCWAALGFSGKRSVRLTDVTSIREHKGRTLFLKGEDGSRFVIDAVAEYQDLRDRLLHAHRVLASEPTGQDPGAAPRGNDEAPVPGG